MSVRAGHERPGVVRVVLLLFTIRKRRQNRRENDTGRNSVSKLDERVVDFEIPTARRFEKVAKTVRWNIVKLRNETSNF